MAVSYISSSSNKSTTTSVVVTAPASLQNGDIMIMIVNSFRSTSATPGAHAVSGWTQIYTRATSTRYIFSIWYKRCASESGNYTASSTSSTQMEAAITVYRGCVPSGSPVDVSSNTAYTTSGTVVRGATITPTIANGFFVWGGFFYLATGNTLTAPSGMNSRETQQNTNNTITLADLAYSTTAASGSKDGTAGATCTVKHAYLLALKPAVPAAMTAGDGAISISALAPTVVASVHTYVTAGVGAVSVTALAPTVAVTLNITIPAATGVVAVTGIAPTVAATLNKHILTDAGVLSVTGTAPVFSTTSVGPAWTSGTVKQYSGSWIRYATVLYYNGSQWVPYTLKKFM